MDIDLLSKMVGELILDNDRVSLPGLGDFVSQVVPSNFSDKGYTINPPYRRLVFRQGRNDDGLLAGLYAKSNNVGKDVASEVIADFVLGMKAVLRDQKVVVFPGLGRLRATRENNIFFVADENLDIYPEGLGLEPVSLKSKPASMPDLGDFDLTPAAAPAVAAVVEEPAAEAPVAETPVETPVDETVVETPVEEPVVEEPVVEMAVEETKEDTKEKTKDLRWLKKTGIGLGIAAGIAALALGAFVLTSRLAPDFIDKILYTEEELEIINYGK